MKLSSASIKNYRGFKNFSTDFSNHTILVGGNNTCKTSLLEAINLVLNPGFYYGPGLLSEYDFHNKQFEQPDDQIRIDLTFTGLTGDELNYFGDYVEPVDQQGNVIDAAPGTKIFDTAPKVLRLYFASQYVDEEIVCGVYYTRQGEDVPASRAGRRKIGFQYLKLHRFTERVFSLGRNSTMQRIIRAKEIDLRQQQNQILAQFPEVADTLLANSDFKQLLETLDTQFRDFTYLAAPQMDTPCIKYEISDLTFSDVNQGVQMFIHTADSDQGFPLTRQGNGTQNALTLALLIHLSELQGNTIVAIDEPELSLHPHAQRYLMRKLKNAGFQLILSTHSPAIAGTFGLADIRLLQRREGELRSYPVDTKALDSGPANAFAILKRKLVEAYFSRAILLVEGDTEEGAFLAFNASLGETGRGLDLDRQELTLFNVEGYKEIGQILNALTPLPIRRILVIDNDEEETFYKSLLPKVDLLIRTPKTPAGDDFEGMIAWESPRGILVQAIEQQMSGLKLARQLPGQFKRRVYRLKEDGQGNPGFLEQLLSLDQNPLYFRDAFPILANWEDAHPQEKGLIRFLYAEVLRGFKGCRPAFEWASLYTPDQLPAGIIDLFEKIRCFLAGNIDSGTEYVLA